MKIHCLLRTSEYRGDHSADVARAVTVRDGETVEDLVARLLTKVAWRPEDGRARKVLVSQESDVIELRVEEIREEHNG